MVDINKATWRHLISWIGLKHLVNLIFKLFLVGEDLGCNSGI
jgi:hypothetical protein